MSSNYFKIVFSLLIAEKLQKEIWKVIVCLTINSNKKWHKISCVADKLSIFKNSSNYVLERWILLLKKKVYMWGNNLILIFDLTYYSISLNGQVYCCCICLFPQVALIGCPWKRMTENASSTAFIKWRICDSFKIGKQSRVVCPATRRPSYSWVTIHTGHFSVICIRRWGIIRYWTAQSNHILRGYI